MRGGLPPFEEFLDATGPTVFRFLRVAVGPTDADDVYQETFLAALRAYPKVRETDKLDRWILAIASRKAIDHHRGASRRPIPVDDVPDAAIDGEPLLADSALWDAVKGLPPKQRVGLPQVGLPSGRLQPPREPEPPQIPEPPEPVQPPEQRAQPVYSEQPEQRAHQAQRPPPPAPRPRAGSGRPHRCP